MDLFKNVRGAEFSSCGQYRYQLWRIWGDGPVAMCIGLNPSKANSEKDDNTIGILIREMKRLGFGGFRMVNLFGLISSKPERLLTAEDPQGANQAWLKTTALMCQEVVFCWGAFKEARGVAEIVRKEFVDGKCFGWNADGSPWHPRALSYKGMLGKAELRRYNGEN